MDFEFVLFIGGIVGSILLLILFGVILRPYFQRRFEEQKMKMRDEVMARGWTYDASMEVIPDQEEHHFSGEKSGIQWKYDIELWHDSGGDNKRFSRWHTESVTLPGEAVLILPNFGGATFQIGDSTQPLGQQTGMMGMVMNMLLKFLVTQVLQADASDAELLKGVRVVQAGGAMLREKYVIMGSDENSAGRLLDSDAETVLLEWAAQFNSRTHPKLTAIVFWQKGLSISIGYPTYDLNMVEKVVDLGLALASGQKGSGW
jgi:hypothetical protein